MTDLLKDIEYKQLIERIGNTYQSAKRKIFSAVNTEMLYAYWQIGKDVVEFEQGGKFKAEYGTQLLLILAKDLTNKHGEDLAAATCNI
jgi:hypothetical protein